MEYVGELIALGIDSVIFGVCLKQYLHYKSAIGSVKKVDLYEVGPSLENAVQKSIDRKIEYVAVTGIVKSIGKPLHAINRKDITGVIQKLSLKEHLVARTTAGFWSNQERTLQKVYNTVPFVLEHSPHKVEVVDALSAEILDMDVVADRFESSVPSFSDHLWGFFTGFRRRGLQTTEEMLREGVIVIGIGEVSKTSKNSLVLQAPSNGAPFCITNMSITSLLRKLDERKRTYRWLCIMFGIIALLISRVIAKRIWKSREERRMAEELHQSLAASRKERRRNVRDSNLRDDQLCVVCRTNPREVILLPCGHVCLCEDCAENITDYCPVCRKQLHQKAAAYIS